MEAERTALLNRILDIFTESYDIERFGEEQAPLAASAAFHEHGTGYMLVRSAEMWSADRHEYSWFFSVDRLTEAVFQQCLNKTLELGQPLVNPDAEGHMSTNLVCVILCDEADPEALRAVKKCRIRKSFQFSLKGWMEVHVAAVEVGKASVTANAYGRLTAEFLKKVLHPKVKRSITSILKRKR